MKDDPIIPELRAHLDTLTTVRKNLEVLVEETCDREDLGIVMAWDTTHAAISSALSSVNEAIARIVDDLEGAE